MKNYLKRKRIALLSILAGIAYLFMIVSSFTDGWDDFLLGFHHDHQDEEFSFNTEDGLLDGKQLDVFYLSIKPDNGFNSFPETLYNNISEQNVYGRFSSLKVLAEVKETSEFPYARLFDVLNGIMMFIIVLLFIFIPFQFFSLIGNIKKNEVFSPINVRMTRRIGVELISIYLLTSSFYYLDYLNAKALFDFPGYTIRCSTADSLLLVIGIAVLIISEVFSRGIDLKEENELMI
jgi:hypothetical protein